jgi:DNA invertase Pin-like site-specific DNA recombinase
MMQNLGMIYGYARASTDAEDLTGSTAQPKAAGCQMIYREKITGTTADRPQLKKTGGRSRGWRRGYRPGY